MKKLSSKYKKYLIRRAKRCHKERQRIGKSYHCKILNIKDFKNKGEFPRLIRDSFADYKKIIAPSNLSLIVNPHQTISFIAELENSFNRKEKVFIDLSSVGNIAEGAILVLLSWMIRFKDNNIDFNGNFPKSPSIKRKLMDSGFFKELYNRKVNSGGEKPVYNVHETTIHTHAGKIVDPALTAKLIEGVSSKIWGEPQRCPGLQRVFIELMHNTNNHSALGKKGEHHWWTSVSYDKTENKATFAFIDYGVGIIQSMKKDSNSRFYKIWDRLAEAIKPRGESEILKMLLEGNLHSSTGEYFRGKGLPGIKEAFEENNIDKLVVISNKAMADVFRNRYEELSNNFTGTFVYWELTPQNHHIEIN